MLLLDLAVAIVNCTGGKKNHGDHSNNNTDRASRSVIRIVPKFEKTIKDSDKIGIF